MIQPGILDKVYYYSLCHSRINDKHVCLPSYRIPAKGFEDWFGLSDFSIHFDLVSDISAYERRKSETEIKGKSERISWNMDFMFYG